MKLIRKHADLAAIRHGNDKSAKKWCCPNKKCGMGMELRYICCPYCGQRVTFKGHKKAKAIKGWARRIRQRWKKRERRHGKDGCRG